jgi:hypothetical protein
VPNLETRQVSLPEKKRLKFLRRVTDFISNFERSQCQLRDVERIHGSLCYISFIYRSGRSRLPSLSNFAASFHGNEFTRRYPPHSLISDLKWWAKELQTAGFYRQLVPRGPPLDLGNFVDASTSWGIGIIIERKWTAYKLAPTWKIPGRDICWLETIAVEIIAYYDDTFDRLRSLHDDNTPAVTVCPEFYAGVATGMTLEHESGR